MPIEIKVPSVGESITRGLLGAWRKKSGEFVREGDVLFELETEKVTSEVYATATGILTQLVGDGADVQIGQVVATIEPAAAPVEEVKQPPIPEPATETPQIDLSPAVRRIIEENKLSPEAIKGSGKEGRLLKEDVLSYLETKISAPPQTIPPSVEEKPTYKPPLLIPPVVEKAISSKRETRKKITPLRKKIADRLVAAQQNAAILTTFNEADMSNVLALRAKFQDRFLSKHGVKLGFMSFFVKAVIHALKTIPTLNARIENDEIVENHYYDIGVAISSEKGLIVPIIREANRLSFSEIEKEIQNLSQKAKAGKITFEELEGGVFTISNGGIFGSLLSTPILNPPQSGILGMHAIQERPIAIQGRVEIRPMMYLALSYDHRIVDGREAVTFLVAIKEFIEQPSMALLEI